MSARDFWARMASASSSKSTEHVAGAAEEVGRRRGGAGVLGRDVLEEREPLSRRVILALSKLLLRPVRRQDVPARPTRGERVAGEHGDPGAHEFGSGLDVLGLTVPKQRTQRIRSRAEVEDHRSGRWAPGRSRFRLHRSWPPKWSSRSSTGVSRLPRTEGGTPGIRLGSGSTGFGYHSGKRLFVDAITESDPFATAGLMPMNSSASLADDEPNEGGGDHL